MINLVQKFPVRFVAAIQATLALAVLFGMPLTPEQLAGIELAVASWLAFLTHNEVTPVKFPNLEQEDHV